MTNKITISYFTGRKFRGEKISPHLPLQKSLCRRNFFKIYHPQKFMFIKFVNVKKMLILCNMTKPQKFLSEKLSNFEVLILKIQDSF